MSFEHAFCHYCHHQVVSGVACDGQPEECPLHPAEPEKRTRTTPFAVTLDEMTGVHEPDAVRSFD